MIRTTRMRTRWQPAVYVIVSLGALYFSVQKLPWPVLGWEADFVILWLSFACLVLGANLWFVLGADQERQHRPSRRRPVDRTTARMRSGEDVRPERSWSE